MDRNIMREFRSRLARELGVNLQTVGTAKRLNEVIVKELKAGNKKVREFFSDESKVKRFLENTDERKLITAQTEHDALAGQGFNAMRGMVKGVHEALVTERKKVAREFNLTSADFRDDARVAAKVIAAVEKKHPPGAKERNLIKALERAEYYIRVLKELHTPETIKGQKVRVYEDTRRTIARLNRIRRANHMSFQAAKIKALEEAAASLALVFPKGAAGVLAHVRLLKDQGTKDVADKEEKSLSAREVTAGRFREEMKQYKQKVQERAEELVKEMRKEQKEGKKPLGFIKRRISKAGGEFTFEGQALVLAEKILQSGLGVEDYTGAKLHRLVRMRLGAGRHRLRIGKYKGKMIEEVWDKDPNYLIRLIDNIDQYVLNDQTRQALFVWSKSRHVQRAMEEFFEDQGTRSPMDLQIYRRRAREWESNWSFREPRAREGFGVALDSLDPQAQGLEYRDYWGDKYYNTPEFYRKRVRRWSGKGYDPDKFESELTAELLSVSGMRPEEKEIAHRYAYWQRARGVRRVKTLRGRYLYETTDPLTGTKTLRKYDEDAWIRRGAMRVVELGRLVAGDLLEQTLKAERAFNLLEKEFKTDEAEAVWEGLTGRRKNRMSRQEKVSRQIPDAGSPYLAEKYFQGMDPRELAGLQAMGPLQQIERMDNVEALEAMWRHFDEQYGWENLRTFDMGEQLEKAWIQRRALLAWQGK